MVLAYFWPPVVCGAFRPRARWGKVVKHEGVSKGGAMECEMSLSPSDTDCFARIVFLDQLAL